MGVEACLESSLTLAKSLLCCNFHSLKACLEACLILAKCLFCSTFHSINGNFHSLEAWLILAKSLICCNFQASRPAPCGLPPPSQVSVLHFRSIPISIASRPAILAKCLFCSLSIASMTISIASRQPRGRACLILAKCLFCSTFYRIHGNFHSLEACFEACLAKCTFHSINGNFHEACLLAKCLFCCNFHSIASNFHSPKAWFEACLGTDCLHVSMSVRMYVCNHVCMSVCLYDCMRGCMYVRLQSGCHPFAPAAA